jgi:hypothetical protein
MECHETGQSERPAEIDEISLSPQISLFVDAGY